MLRSLVGSEMCIRDSTMDVSMNDASASSESKTIECRPFRDQKYLRLGSKLLANGAIVFWTESLRPDLCCGFASTVTFVGPRPRPLLVPVNRAQRDTSPLYSRSLQKVQSDGLHRTALRHRVPLAPEVGCRSIPSTVCPKVRINRLLSLIVLLLVRFTVQQVSSWES